MTPKPLLLIISFCQPIFSTTITVQFTSLPSAQGWTFNSPSGLAESSVFSLGDDYLQQNTLGSSNNVAYYNVQAPGLYDPALPFDLTVSAVVLGEQLFPPPDASNGFEIGVAFNNLQAALSLGLDRISYSSPTNFDVNVPSDNSVIRTFDLHWDGSSVFSYFINGSLVASAGGSLLGGSTITPTIFLGDQVSFANAKVDVTELVFSQASVPEPASTSLFAVGMLVIICARLISFAIKNVQN